MERWLQRVVYHLCVAHEYPGRSPKELSLTILFTVFYVVLGAEMIWAGIGDDGAMQVHVRRAICGGAGLLSRRSGGGVGGAARRGCAGRKAGMAAERRGPAPWAVVSLSRRRCVCPEFVVRAALI
eukprot:COSAG01_NODE_675_length_14330_cov_20.977022_16_plen_125_part_00